MASKLKLTELLHPDSVVAAITINADNSVTIPTQSTTNLAYTGTLTGGTGVVNIGSGQIYKDASGNVGIGTSSPAQKLNVVGNTLIPLTNSYFCFSSNLGIGTPDSAGLQIFTATADTIRFGQRSGGTTFSEKARFDDAGNFMIGITAAQSGIGSDPAGVTIYGTGTSLGATILVRNNPNSVLYVNNKTAGACSLEIFYSGGNLVGEITSSGTGVAYGTASDYRLKENVAPMQNALATVAALKPVTYTWKADGSDGQGFIAHELQAVVPDCVTGTKDAVDAEGNPKYQGVDTSFLVATLVAALQEQQALIQDLTTRLTALEGN